MSEIHVDELCKKVLRTTESPSEELNTATKALMKERITMRKSRTNKFRVAAAVVAAVLVLPLGVTAAVRYLSPKEVAEELDYPVLAEAFEGGDSILINEKISSGGYDITLMGVTFGKNLSGFSEEAEAEKTYAVVAIEKQNGESMGFDDFFVSPLIKGCKPWQVNTFTLNSGGSGATYFIKDGIQYRLEECDSVEIFADREVYIGVSNNSGQFCNNESFNYNEETGEITPNAENGAVSAVFTLPLDKSKADPEKAAEVLEQLTAPPEETPEKRRVAVEESETGFETKIEDGEDIGVSIFTPDGTSLTDTHIFTDAKLFQQWYEERLESDRVSGVPEEALQMERSDYEDYLKDIENGGTLTIWEYDDGSIGFAVKPKE